MKMLISILSLLSLSQSAVAQENVHSTQVYLETAPSQWLFDLIKHPTMLRNSKGYSNAAQAEVGFTEIAYTAKIHCIAHGKSLSFPTQTSEASLVSCNLYGVIDSVDSKSLEFEGDLAKAIFELLPNTQFSQHSDFDHYTMTRKFYGLMGENGIACTFVQLDPGTIAVQPEYACNIAWK